MLRILKSLMVIGIVTTIAVGATGAYFSDTVTVPQNTFASGELNLTVSPQSAGVTVANAAPGQWFSSAKFLVYNQSTFNEALKWRVSSHLDSQTLSGFYGQLNVSVWAKGLGYDQTPKTAPDGSTIEAQNVWNGKLKDLEHQFNNMPQNWSANLWFFVQLDPSAGNQYQGQSATFDLIFDATQASNPGWV